MRYIVYVLLCLVLLGNGCRSASVANPELQSTEPQTPSQTASPLMADDTFVWEQVQAEHTVTVIIYRPTFLPPQYAEPKLAGMSVDSTGKPEYTVVYTAPDALLAFILGTGAGALGNFPPFPPTTTESLSIENNTATLIVVASQSPPSQAMDVTWQDQEGIYNIRCFGNACNIDDIRQIALSMVRVDPGQ